MIRIFVLCLAVTCIAAQDKPAGELLRFEVASIKPVEPDTPHMVGVRVYPGGRVVISGLSVKMLVVTAFGLSYWQISGGDSWVEKDAYNIEAKPAQSWSSRISLRHSLFGIDDEHLREMLQALLIDRFRLKFHRETKTGDVYVLEKNGKTLRLRPADPAEAGSGAPDSLAATSYGNIGYVSGMWSITGFTMPQLAKFAADQVVHAPVRDRTELSGAFDYRQAVPDEEPNYQDNSASFVRFISELGLKLDRSKGPVETFVIDYVAKPSPN
jgi:uncharacterized protein (TIGR03435 family)